MSIFSKLKSFFSSPTNRYEATHPTRTHAARREARSGDHALWMAGKSLREQARWLDENHDIAIGILDKLEERVVGNRGIMIEHQPKDHSGEVIESLAEEIAGRWAAWSLSPEVTGVMTRPELERMALRSTLRDGEVFGKLVRGRVPGLMGNFSIEALEADLVPDDLNYSEHPSKVISGIRVNGWRRPVEYNVLLDHPGDMVGARYQYRQIPARDIIHLAHRKRLHQIRGVSIFHGILIRLSDLKDYEDSERIAARIAASLGLYIKKGSPDSYSESDERSERFFDFTPGATFDDLEVGEDIGMISADRPNRHMTDFRNGQIRAAAAGVRVGYSSISRDYSGSYSSQRQELVESFEGYSVLQDWFVAQWSRPVYREWLKMECLGDLELPPDLDHRTLFDAVYMGPVMPWIDPTKEASAWQQTIDGEAASRSEWIRARGRNPREVRAAIKTEASAEHNNHTESSETKDDQGKK